MRAAAAVVGAELELPVDWLNDAAKGYLHGLALGEVVIDTPSLRVRAVAPEQLLAMKLSAWRDDVDVADARLLLSKLHGERDAVWTLVEPCPVASSRRAMLSTTSGRPTVELRDLVVLLLTHQTLAARQWVADAQRAGVHYGELARPDGLDPTGVAVAAGIVELLAERAGEAPPAWTATVGAAPEVTLLVQAAATLPRLRHLCETEGPEPLRRRRILAPPEFLSAA